MSVAHIFFLLTSVVLSSHCFAATLYKYRDENGRWVMTDKKPAQKGYEQQALLYTPADAKVTVVNRGSKERPMLYAVNQTFGPAQVWLELKETDNVKWSNKNELEWLVPGPGDMFLLQLQAKDEGKSWRYEIIPHFALGVPTQVDSSSTPILGLPVLGGPFPMSQSFKGEASHSSHIQAYYAVDIVVPENTPIVAVKSGRVMDVERNFSRSGWSEEYADEANYVRVLHDDDTMAVYAHLRADGIEVVPGQHIKTGQILAYSGNTGFSTGPHLHFSLQINSNKLLQSIPFQFVGVGREPVVGDLILHAADKKR